MRDRRYGYVIDDIRRDGYSYAHVLAGIYKQTSGSELDVFIVTSCHSARYAVGNLSSFRDDLPCLIDDHDDG